jgi:hypothetical protein
MTSLTTDIGHERLELMARHRHANLNCGIKFDDTLLNHERLRSIRLAAALMHSPCATSEAANREGVENRIEP